mgnify:CR=1 FL=1
MREQKKGAKGIVANYVTRTKAVRSLQVTLKDFRYCVVGLYDDHVGVIACA